MLSWYEHHDCLCHQSYFAGILCKDQSLLSCMHDTPQLIYLEIIRANGWLYGLLSLILSRIFRLYLVLHSLLGREPSIHLTTGKGLSK